MMLALAFCQCGRCLLTVSDWRWCFRRHRLRSGHDNLRLASIGQVSLSDFADYVSVQRRLVLL